MSEWKPLSQVQLFATLWTIQSMEFSRWEYWVGSLSLLQGIFPTQGWNPGVDSLPAELPEKPKNTGMGSLSLLQRIFLTQELNWGLWHCRWILYQLGLSGKPYHTYMQSPWCAQVMCYPFSGLLIQLFFTKKKSNIPTKSTFEDCERKGNINGKKNRRKRLKRKINRWFVSIKGW